MKYIRTKDGKILGFEPYNKELDLIAYLSQFVNYQGEYAPIKQADTIEELCDMFILLNKDNGRHKVCYPQDIGLNMSIFKGLGAVNQELYGAIWTDKGLIYVAKMNDKGELELL